MKPWCSHVAPERKRRWETKPWLVLVPGHRAPPGLTTSLLRTVARSLLILSANLTSQSGEWADYPFVNPKCGPIAAELPGAVAPQDSYRKQGTQDRESERKGNRGGSSRHLLRDFPILEEGQGGHNCHREGLATPRPTPHAEWGTQMLGIW